MLSVEGWMLAVEGKGILAVQATLLMAIRLMPIWRINRGNRACTVRVDGAEKAEGMRRRGERSQKVCGSRYRCSYINKSYLPML
ncbi:hypothetical protein DZC30_11770 [Comamonas testosteroni]|uniref:Uncharacterized protein n=1 Tax=Comamonas testosteroni TaxID=285 RepID=A0A373FM42_COMTE|nr:hypothetical protein DZC30_11770 [Comamonas testosteroni]